MKAPLSWLAERCGVTAPAEAVAAVMSVRGFAVEGIERLPDGDAVLDFEVTANRPDCLSVAGLAREVATAFGVPPPGHPPLASLAPAIDARLPLRIDAPDWCPQYTGALAEVRVAPSPDWLQARLRACGVRPINNIVDVTNYVLLELGQPMHAFDATRLEGHEIRVRRAQSGERLRTLDGETRSLTEDMLVIADAARPIAVAGVMGGADSEVDDATEAVVLESASFDPLSVRRTSKALGLKTEASLRFERGVDRSLPAVALARACALIEEIGAGRPTRYLYDCHPRPALPRALHLRARTLEGLLGLAVPSRDVERILSSLGFAIEATQDGWQVVVPTWRVDVHREVDLVEEVGRHYGLDKIPLTFPALLTPAPPADPRIASTRRLRHTLVGAGFVEAITFGFMARAAASPFAVEGDVVAIANPLSETFAVLRPSLVPGLVAGIAHNRRRQQEDVRLFEVGSRFTRSGGERRAVALALVGSLDPPHWSGGAAPLSFFDAKAAVDLVCQTIGLEVTTVARPLPWLMPGQSAEIRAAGAPVGALGRLASTICESHGLTHGEAVFVAEVDLESAAVGRVAPQVVPLPRFPSVTRDIALLVDASLEAATLRDTVRAAAPPTLVGVREFDRYQGKGIPEGKVSLAIRLTFRSPERTLTDEDVQGAVDGIVDAVRQSHGAAQR